MIDLCKERKINVILLTMPVYHTYSENINEKKISKIFESCEELEIANKNTFYLNYFYDKKFELTDYFDEHHLSSEGALKMSNIINEELVKIQLNLLDQ